MKTALLIGLVLLMQQAIDAKNFYHSSESRQSSEEYWHTRPSTLRPTSTTTTSTTTTEPTTTSTTTTEPTTPSTTTTTTEPTTTSTVAETTTPTETLAVKSAILDGVLDGPRVPAVGIDGQAIPVPLKELDDIDFGDINCPNRCTSVYAPICARRYTELVLFYNKCVLDVAKCRNPYITWEIVPLNRCRYSNELWSNESWEFYG